MNAVVVDDEINSLQYLVNILEKREDINVQKQFTDSCEALAYLIRNPVDVLFLDIEMPNINGIYLAEQIISLYPEIRICFVTAYNEFAVKAFEINAIDYVLKPYTEARIIQAIKKMSNSVAHVEAINQLSEESDYDLDIICGTQDEEVVLIKYDEIFYLDAVDGNILIHTNNQVYKSNKTLNFFEDKLKKRSFFRTHKCYIANLNKVNKFKPRINYTYDVYFNGIKDVIPLSRNKVKELKSFFSI